MYKPTKNWTTKDEERRLCEMWLKDPLVNPQTGHHIKRNGQTFNKWKQRCKKLGLRAKPLNTKEMTWHKCQEWRRHPDINPETGRKITINGPTYNRIQQQCRLIQEPEIKLEGKYYLPDRLGMVPAVLDKGLWYVVRHLNQRNVWGPLNKPATKVKPHYFSHTWDYRNNHYRPIFIGGAPSSPKIFGNLKAPPKRMAQKSKPKPKAQDPKYMVDNILSLFL